MAVHNLDAYMVKAMCSNVKMEFDLAKANFLEIQEAMETFHSYLKRVEQIEKQQPNNTLDDDLVHLKDAVTRAKENMNVLRGRLAKNTTRAREGYRLLADRLQKMDEKLNSMQSKKRTYVTAHNQYKKLRRSVSSEPVQDVLVDRQKKLHLLEGAVKETEDSINVANKEKEVLQEACDKMQVFLEDTKGVMNHFKEHACNKKKATISLLTWFSGLISTTSDLHLMREHSVDERSVAVECLNQSNLPGKAPRLVLTIMFEHMQRGLYPYAAISIKSNIESLEMSDLVDEAIEKNDITGFLLKVQKRWWSHIPLLTEIIQLRDKYAIDWLVEQNRLRLMLGNAGRVICTLAIPKMYPSKGDVTLDKVDGNDLGTLDIDKPKVASITGWLKHLSELLK